MNQEDKQLLLKDLCSRLPYGVICNTPKGDGHLCSINQTIFGTEYGINIKATTRDYFNDRKVCIKPYLRPLYSTTEEEKRHISKMTLLRTYDNGVVYDIPYDVYTPYYVMEDCLNYLRSIHIDYSGLIEKGLAIAVTKENNPYKD